MTEAVLAHQLYALQVIRPLLRYDRSLYIAKCVREAAEAARRGDGKALWSLIHRLSVRKSAKTLPAVKTADGSQLLISEDDVKRRWSEHVAELLCADRLPNVESLMPWPDMPMEETSFMPGLTDVCDQMRRMKAGKAAGLDGLPAELLRCGGLSLALLVTDLISHIVRRGAVPVQFRGGRLQDIWKTKGSPQICSHSRGLLIADELGKIFTGILQVALTPAYVSYMPDMQCGAVPARGAYYANRLARSVLD